MKKPKNIPKQKTYHLSFLIFMILIVVIPNLLYSPAMDQQLEIRMLGLSLFLGLLLLPLIFIQKMGMLKQTELSILRNPAVIIYAIFILFIGLSIFWATNQSEAIYEFLKRISFFILFLYLLLYVLPEEKSRFTLIKSFIIFSLLIAVTGFLQILKIFSATKYSIDAIYSITGNFAQKNIFSEVLFITFAFCVYGIAVMDKIWKRLAITGSLLTLLLIAFLMTRAIWAAFFIALIFTVVLYLIYVNKNQLGGKIKSGLRYVVIIFGIVVIGVVAFSVLDKNKTLQHQITNAFDFKQGNTYHRLNLWKKTIALAEKHPIVGVGAGNWRIEILQYDLQVTTDKGRIMPDRTHNDYLQVLAENGIIGLTLFLLLFVILLYFCIRTLQKAEHFQDSIFSLILFFALLGYMIDSSFAFPRERIELQIFLNIIFAFIVFEYTKRFGKEKETKSQISIKAFAMIILGVMAITSYAAIKRLQAEVGINKIYNYTKENKQPEIIKITNEIYSPFSSISPFCDPILEIRATSMYKDHYDLKEVLETYENSLRDSPYHLETINALAIIYKNEKNYSKALEYINTALKYGPTDTRANLIKAEILMSMNKTEEAYQQLRTMEPSNNNPDYRKALNYLLFNKIREMMSQTKNEYFSMQVSNMVGQADVVHQIYSNSIHKNEAFEKTLLDTVFAVCDQNKIINDPSVQQIKIKYNIKK